MSEAVNKTNMDLTRERFQQSINELRKYLPHLELFSLDDQQDEAVNDVDNIKEPTLGKAFKPETINSVYNELIEPSEYDLSNQYDPGMIDSQNTLGPSKFSADEEFEWLKSPYLGKYDLQSFDEVQLRQSVKHEKSAKQSIPTHDSSKIQEELPSIVVPLYDPDRHSVNPDMWLDRKLLQSYNDLDYLRMTAPQRINKKYYRSSNDRYFNR